MFDKLVSKEAMENSMTPCKQNKKLLTPDENNPLVKAY